MIFPFPQLSRIKRDSCYSSKRCVRGGNETNSDLASTFDVRHEERDRQTEKERQSASPYERPLLTDRVPLPGTICSTRRSEKKRRTARRMRPREGEERKRERLSARHGVKRRDSFSERVDRVPCIARNVTRQRVGETRDVGNRAFNSIFRQAEKVTRRFSIAI